MKLCFVDLESTGLDTENDRIVEIAFLLRDPTGEHDDYQFHTGVHPEMNIPAEATKVHGISDSDVADLPTFHHWVTLIQEIIDAGVIMVGYNSRRFDIPMLHNELRRCGGKGLPTTDNRIDIEEIDLFEVWRASEARSLSSAALRFAGEDHGDGAHNAEADVAVLPKIMEGMVRDFEIIDNNEGLDSMRELSVPEWAVDRDGKFKKREDGKIVFNFGQHMDTPVARQESYLAWMAGKDFSAETISYVNEFLAKLRAG